MNGRIDVGARSGNDWACVNRDVASLSPVESSATSGRTSGIDDDEDVAAKRCGAGAEEEVEPEDEDGDTARGAGGERKDVNNGMSCIG